jgi:membrane protein
LLLFLQELFKELKKANLSDLSAQLAFYFLLSIFPLMIFLLTLLPYLDLEPKEIMNFFQEFAPGGTGSMLEKQITSLVNGSNKSLLSFSVLATIWTASGGTSAIIRSIHYAYNTEETRPLWKQKWLAILLTISIVAVVVLTLLLPVFGKVLLGQLSHFFELTKNIGLFLHFVRWTAGFSVMVIVLMMLYYLAPNVNHQLKEVVWGAIFATLFWQLISLAFSFYVSNFENYSSTYGSLGAVIILMIWFYLSGMAIILGGIINGVLFNRHSKCDSVNWESFFIKTKSQL